MMDYETIFTLQENVPSSTSDFWHKNKKGNRAWGSLCQSVFGASMAIRSEKYSHTMGQEGYQWMGSMSWELFQIGVFGAKKGK